MSSQLWSFTKMDGIKVIKVGLFLENITKSLAQLCFLFFTHLSKVLFLAIT